MVLPWVAAFLVIAVVGAGSVAAIVVLGFGPGSFVSAYLDALARRDAASALALPGVGAGSGSRALLTSAALPGLSGIGIIGDVEHDGGLHRVTARWSSHGVDGQTSFEVERIGTRFGVFPIWGFAQSPLARLSLEVRNARDVTAETQPVRTPGVGAHGYALLVPGDYRFAQRTALVGSAQESVDADTVGERLSASVDVEATPRFLDEVSTKVRALLARCATQKVLFPTGCPFGREIDDRVVSDPVWSVVREPEIRLEGTGDDASWTIPAVPGTAHLRVRVESLYDGSTSTVDEDVPFTISATVTVGEDGTVITVADVR